MKTIDITPQEQQALLGMLDLAVKAGGLQVAEIAVYFKNKFAMEIPVDGTQEQV